MERIGFIGLGIMGKSMARNLMKSGYKLNAFARHPEKVEDIVKEGLQMYTTIEDCVKDCDVVITMVGYPKDVEEVYFGEQNILDSTKSGACLIDMTSTSPTLAQRIYREGSTRGFHVLDAPVTGGDVGAKNGTLSILVGGDHADFKRCLPLLRAMGSSINYQGPAGYGQHAKIANQIMVAGALAGVCEALAYAECENLDQQALLQAVSGGAAASGQLKALGPKILDGDFAPGFFLKHFIKDMMLVEDEADKVGLELGMIKQVLRECRVLEEKGMGDYGTQVLIEYYRKHSKLT